MCLLSELQFRRRPMELTIFNGIHMKISVNKSLLNCIGVERSIVPKRVFFMHIILRIIYWLAYGIIRSGGYEKPVDNVQLIMSIEFSNVVWKRLFKRSE